MSAGPGTRLHPPACLATTGCDRDARPGAPLAHAGKKGPGRSGQPLPSARGSSRGAAGSPGLGGRGSPGGSLSSSAAGLALAELVREAPAPERVAAARAPVPGPGEEVPAEEQGGIPIPSSGLLQVAERRQPLSSVSSLEVHFDLLDLTELTDMSDQELAEVFADSDDENVAESPGGLQPHALPRAGYLRSPSWTRGKAEQGRDRTRLGDSELQAGEADTFLTVERPQDE
ncbi:PREDICTED: dysbindin domain-containing protein 1 [Crocodylus porosus]|uniref:dysbindin domain-containing protein 1 n=1 Tax=Crocodylus porosus TaxID=8502 RepID=UPI00093A4536|nr:PREDICTED: dysbindin domain-containing protein 1 [Crocodylus porosus]